MACICHGSNTIEVYFILMLNPDWVGLINSLLSITCVPTGASGMQAMSILWLRHLQQLVSKVADTFTVRWRLVYRRFLWARSRMVRITSMHIAIVRTQSHGLTNCKGGWEMCVLKKKRKQLDKQLTTF